MRPLAWLQRATNVIASLEGLTWRKKGNLEPLGRPAALSGPSVCQMLHNACKDGLYTQQCHVIAQIVMAFNLNNVPLPFVAYVQQKTFMTLKQLQRNSDPFTFFWAIQTAAMVSILFFTGCRPGLLGPTWVGGMAISTYNVQVGQTMCST